MTTNMAPRDYFSWSQFNTIWPCSEASKKRYAKIYIQGAPSFQNKHMVFGKKIAALREVSITTDDEILEGVLSFLPQYPQTEYEDKAKVRINGKRVTLLGKYDGVDFKKHIIGDDKVAVKSWKQKDVDKWKQLTWYAYIYYLNTGKIPKLDLNVIGTEEYNGVIVATGNTQTFRTTRTITDFLRLQVEINKAWTAVLEVMESEWAQVV